MTKQTHRRRAIIRSLSRRAWQREEDASCSRLLVGGFALDQFLGLALESRAFGIVRLLRLFLGFSQWAEHRCRFVLLAELVLSHRQEVMIDWREITEKE